MAAENRIAGLRSASAAPLASRAPSSEPSADLRAERGKPASSVGLQRLVAGINPLLGAANVLLALVPQLRATTAHADPGRLRQQLLERVAEFEADARTSGVPRPKILAARYILCSFLDEVIASTPWGSDGAWAQSNLLQAFHDERWGGDKAFKLLERLGEDVPANADVLELFYVCLALGFEGRYAGKPNRRAQLDAIATRLAEALRPPPAEQGARTLSLRWQGVPTRDDRRLTAVPLWALAAFGGVVVVAVVLVFGAQLEASAAPVFRQIHAVASALRVDAKGSGAAAAKPRLAAALPADVASRTIAVRDEAMRSVVSLAADDLFVPGTAQIDPQKQPVLLRIAGALANLPGNVVIVGHTDNVPVKSLQFPSSWHLTYERAQAVMAALAQAGIAPGRLRAEGRADAQPLASNDTAEGRATNRRIDVELQLPRPER